LREQVAGQSGEDTARVCKPIRNPFTNLTKAGKAKLRLRGVDPERLAKLKAVVLTGRHAGLKNFVNRDPETVLAIARGFTTEGDVYSAGPILAVADAVEVSGMTGADLVWLAGEPIWCLKTDGLPVILAPSACRSLYVPHRPGLWCGDYGWRRPDDFL